MQYIGTIIHYCRICGKELLRKDLKEYSWVCPECNEHQLQSHGLISVNEEGKRLKEDQKYSLRGRLNDQGAFTVDEAAKASSVSRRTVFNRIKRYRELIVVIKNENQTRVAIKKLSRLNNDIKKKTDWALQSNPLIQKGLKSAMEVFDFPEVISLEEAVKVTGLTRRYLRKLIRDRKIRAIEPLHLTGHKTPLRDLKPEEIRKVKPDQDSLGYLGYYRIFKQHSPVVFVDKDAVLRRTWRSPGLQQCNRPQSRTAKPSVSPKDKKRLAMLLPLLHEEMRSKLNIFPEEYRLEAVLDYLQDEKTKL